MKKLRATNPLVLFVGALAIGLAGCADDVIITEPPPPPPPPPPEAAEISIVYLFDPSTDLQISDDDVVGRFGIGINFDTGGFEAASLSVFVDSDEVPCQTFSGQAAVISADVQTVECIVNSAEGVGACVGLPLQGRFPNGPHTIAAELTLDDGSTVRATRSRPVNFTNDDAVIVVPNDIGPRVVGTDEMGWWGGPRDLSWYICPIAYTPGLAADVCEITVSGEDLWLSGEPAPGLNTDVLDETPFITTAQYRDDPDDDPDWVDSGSFNEDRVEDDDQAVFVTKVLACDGTNITGAFDLFADVRPIDTSAPLCDDDPCEVWIDDDYPINDGNAAGFTNNLFSAGDFDLRDDDGDLVDDDGVGLVQGVTTVLNAWDYADGDQDNFVLFAENIFGVADLDEDDACGDDGTTDPALGAATFATAYGQCDATGEAGPPVDAYFIEIAEVGDLLGNQLGDGTADLQIEDEFITELDAPSGIVGSGQLGKDATAPDLDELMPPSSTPLFVWNPDLGLTTPYDPLDALCPSTDPTECETVMFETADPDLASGDPGSGVEEVDCDLGYPNSCLDANGDGATPASAALNNGRRIFTEILDSPADAYNDADLVTDDTGTPGDDMFQSYICDGIEGASCDGTDDGTYQVRVTSTDKAQVVNNRTQTTYSFIIDVTPPVIGFGGITGLNSSNAATVQFILDASVTDRNGNGTAVTLATVQVTLESGLDFDCGLGATFDEYQDVLVTPPNNPDPDDLVIVNVTSQVQANNGDFSVTFTAANQSAANGLGPYTYCFEITADDGAERKDGSDDGVEVSSDAGKNFTWQ